MKKPTKNRPSFSSHGTFKFTILFGALVTIDHTLSLPLLFSTKNKPKETNYAAKKETHKINLLFKFTLKNVTGIDEENLTKCIDCVIYLQSSLSSSRLAWRAFIWLAFHFNFSFCAFSLKRILLWCTKYTLGIGIQRRICTSELCTIIHIPKHPNDLIHSFVLRSVCLYVFFFIFLLWIFFYFRISNVKKWKKSVDFSSFTVQKTREKNVSIIKA